MKNGIVFLVFLLFALSSCGEKEITLQMLIDAKFDYVGERVRITAVISSKYPEEDTGGVIIHLTNTAKSIEILCFFPIDAPPPPYIRDGRVTISGLVKLNSKLYPRLVECRVIE